MGVSYTFVNSQGPEIEPSWWRHRGVVDEQRAEANKSVVNVGQLKWITRQLHEELSMLLPEEAEIFGLDEVNPLVPEAYEPASPHHQNYVDWKSGNQSVASLGQLKNSAVKFYDLLYDISPAWLSDQLTRSGHPADGRKYPWTVTSADDANKAPANIGQLKSVFSLRLRESLDDDLLPDIFEHALVKFVPAFFGKALDQITWKPGDAHISLTELDGNGVSVTTPTATIAPNIGGSKSGVISAADLLREHEAVGSVGGSFAVGGDGSANYSIPINIPKGTSGMEPQIALSYSSGGGNGNLGVGFDISGFQRITRGATDRLKDGFFDPVDFDGNDRFYFDGELLIATTNVSGGAATADDYGKDGTVYQTETNSFARITSHGQLNSGPHHWTVETKAGLVIELGNCGTSCVSNPGGKGALVWNVNRVSDNVGNYYKVEYQLDIDGGPLDYRLARVKYTGNGTSAPYNEVQFVWEDRQDIAEAFVQGVKVRNAKRLQKVDVYGASQLLFSYNLTYHVYTAKNYPSRLISVQKSLPGGSTLPPTQIHWKSDEIEEVVSGRSPWFNSSRPEMNQPQWTSGDNQLSTLIDMTGDGLLDKVSYFNADKPDSYVTRLVHVPGRGNGWYESVTDENPDHVGIWVAVNNGDGFEEQVMWYKPMLALSHYPTNYDKVDYRTINKQYSYPKFGERAGFYDVNGDGLPDRVTDLDVSNPGFVTVTEVWKYRAPSEYPATYHTMGLWVALNTGSGFGALQRWYNTSKLEEGSLNWSDGAHNTYSTFLDVNGDGLPDRVNHRNYDLPGAPLGFYVSLNTGSGFSPEKILWGTSVRGEENYSSWGSGENVYSGLLDMNGDGLLDKVDHYNYSIPSQGYGVYVSLNDGTGSFGTKTKWLAVTNNNQGFFSWGEYSGFIDINRDGLPDRVDHYDYSTNTPGVWVSINKGEYTGGSGFYPKQKWLSETDQNYSRISYHNSAGEYYAGFHDLNGDGLVDRVRLIDNGPDGTGLYVALNKGAFESGSGFGPYSKWFSSPIREANFPTWGSGADIYAGFVDMNGDGLLDRIMNRDPVTGAASGRMWVAINNGHGFDAGLPAPGSGAAGGVAAARVWYTSSRTEQAYLAWSDLSQLIDLNGDGLLDRVDHHNYEPNRPTGQPASAMWVSVNKGRGYNEHSNGFLASPVITSIEDGLGAEIKIEYKRGSKDEVDNWGRRLYTPSAYNQSEAEAGIINVNGAGNLVSRYAEQDGLGGYRWMRQYYGERKVDRNRQQDLGFKWIESIDEQRGRGSITTYSQEFPYQNLPLESISYIPSGTNKILTSKETYSYGKHADISGIGGKIRFVFQTGSNVSDFAFEGPHSPISTLANASPLAPTFQGNQLSWVSTTNDGFDAWGNLTASSSITSDGFGTVCSNIYDPPNVSSGKWILGRLKNSTVTKTGPAGYTPVTKSSAFEYYTDGAFMGMLKSETAEPSDPLAVKKTYGYDSWGNKSVTTITALNGDQPPRSSFVQYDLTGRFPIEESNQLGHKVTYQYDNARSLLLSTTDANGLSARYFYDPWGTKVLTRGPDGTEGAEITRYATPNDIPAGTGLDPVRQKIVFIRKTQGTGAAATTAYIDAQGRVLMSSAESFDGRLVYSRTDYDEFGRQYQQSLPFFIGDAIKWSSVEFDGADRSFKTHAADGSISSASYQGFTTVLTNALNQTQTRIVNAQGWLTSTLDNDGNETTFSYSVDGKPKQTSAPGSHVIDTEIDIFGQKKSMTDSDVGTSSTDYYAFGETKKSTDGNGATSEVTYDILGRQTTRIIKKSSGTVDSTTTWTYDDAPGAGKGKVHTVQMKDGFGVTTYSSSVRYDSLGRVSESTVSHHGETFKSLATYDSIGRPRTETDAGGLTVVHEYNERGFETGIRDYYTGELYWKPLEYDAAGRLLREELGNGVINTNTFDQERGTLTGSQSQKGGASLQNMSYVWDATGNFKKRTDHLLSLSEDFHYDSLNRLDWSQVSGKAQLNYNYSVSGNLTSKSNVGTYAYDGARPHAVASISGANGVTRTFEYDLNGSITIEKRNGQQYREVVWTAHADVKSFTLLSGPRILKIDGTEIFAAGKTETKFDYDAALERNQKITERDRLSREITLYLGSYERIVTATRPDLEASYATQKVEHRHNIGGLALKTITEQDGNTLEDTAYYLKDHLGSISALLDRNGMVKERYSFDAWGSRRDATTWSDSVYNAFTKVTSTNRGYTGHEMLDEIGLVHMNGRIYDPEIGRVLSGDPVIQEPDNSQNYNRYSYVINNPLSFTDPSGFSFLKKIFSAHKKLHSKINDFRKSVKHKTTKWLAENEWAMVVVTVIVGIVTFGIGIYVASAVYGAGLASFGAAFTAMASGAAIAGGFAGAALAGGIAGALSGAFNAAISGGDWGDILKGAVVGGIQGAISSAVLHPMQPGVGEGFSMQSATHIGAHGVVGGTANAVMGGKFQDGFISAAVGAAAGNMGLYGSTGGGNLGIVRRTITAGIVGGTASELGGGKFANGAYTSAFQHLLNFEFQKGPDGEPDLSLPPNRGVQGDVVFGGLQLYAEGVAAGGVLRWVGSLFGRLLGPAAGRVFWSGGDAAKLEAQALAKSTGGTTLEMTLPGKMLDKLTTPKTYPYLKPVWNFASARFANGAAGPVKVVQPMSGVRLESVWRTREYPILFEKGNPLNYHILH